MCSNIEGSILGASLNGTHFFIIGGRKMRKFLALLLSMIIICTLVACDNNATPDMSTTANNETGASFEETTVSTENTNETTSVPEGTEEIAPPIEETQKPTENIKPTETTKPNNPNGISDNNPPKLESFKFVENGQEFGVGDTVHVQMKVTDDSKVDINRTYPVISNGDHYIWFNMTYNSATGYLEGSYTFKETDVIGKYSLNYIPCYDIYGNYYHGIISGNHYITFG